MSDILNQLSTYNLETISSCSLFIPSSPWQRSKACTYAYDCTTIAQWPIFYVGIYSMNLFTIQYYSIHAPKLYCKNKFSLYSALLKIDLLSVLPESLNKKSPNFWKPQKTFIKAILKSQKTYIKGLSKVAQMVTNRQIWQHCFAKSGSTVYLVNDRGLYKFWFRFLHVIVHYLCYVAGRIEFCTIAAVVFNCD